MHLTGFPCVGLNGTSHCDPQSEHVALCISLGLSLNPRLLPPNFRLLPPKLLLLPPKLLCGLLFLKHSWHFTGFPSVGLNGTSHSCLHSEQIALCISLSSILFFLRILDISYLMLWFLEEIGVYRCLLWINVVVFHL